MSALRLAIRWPDRQQRVGTASSSRREAVSGAELRASRETNGRCTWYS